MLSLNEDNWRNLGTPSACKLCKGYLCCQYNACSTSPDDFDRDTCQMRNELLSGNYSIDLVRSEKSFKFNGQCLTLDFKEIENNPTESFYIRARNTNSPIVDLIHGEAESYGPCVFWDADKGCKLSYNNRPKFGRTLVPMPFGACYDYYDKYTPQGLRGQIVNEWKPFHNHIMGMIYEFAEKDKIYQLGLLPPFKLII